MSASLSSTYSGVYNESNFFKAVCYHIREWSINHKYDCEKDLLDVLKRIYDYTSHNVWTFRTPTHADSQELINLICSNMEMFRAKCPDLCIMLKACMDAREVDACKRALHKLEEKQREATVMHCSMVTQIVPINVEEKKEEKKEEKNETCDNIDADKDEDEDEEEEEDDVEEISDDDDEEEFDVVVHVPNPITNAPGCKRQKHVCLKCIEPKRLRF